MLNGNLGVKETSRKPASSNVSIILIEHQVNDNFKLNWEAFKTLELAFGGSESQVKPRLIKTPI